MTMLKMGEHELELGGKYMGTLREANDLLGDADALHARMEEDGYLLIRGLHNPAKVREARRVVLENLNANNQIDANFPLSDGVAATGGSGAFMGGKKAVTHSPEFLGVVEAPELMEFFANYFRGDELTYDYKWLRAVAPGAATNAHYDIVYMGRGTKNVVTCWTPLGDVPLEAGPLAILVGSHRFERIKATYGEMDVDRDNVGGWFSNDPIELVDRYGGQWQTTEFQMGDALIFSMFTMHVSIVNTTNRYRISTDSRYQRSDEPVDERWIGDDPIAHYAWNKTEPVPMEVMREKWGV
jgi:hypothetical protein